MTNWQILTETIVEDESFVVPSFYSMEKVAGAGSYGVVVSAKNNIDGTKVAIKKCKDIFKRS
jgi:hypothetical protein